MEDRILTLLIDYLRNNHVIDNQTFFDQISAPNGIIKKHYSNKLLVGFFNSGKIKRFIKGYYYLQACDVDIINTLFIKKNGTYFGYFSGQYLLNRYQIIDQIPVIITIKSAKYFNDIIQNKYRIETDNLLFSNTTTVALLNDNNLIFEFLELMYCIKQYDIDIDAFVAFDNFCKVNQIDMLAFCNQLLTVTFPNARYYQTGRTIKKNAKVIKKELSAHTIQN